MSSGSDHHCSVVEDHGAGNVVPITDARPRRAKPITVEPDASPVVRDLPRTWTLTGSYRPERLLLAGRLANGEPWDVATMRALLARLGVDDPDARRAGWHWCAVFGDERYDIDDNAQLGDAALVGPGGLTVPLALVPRVFGERVDVEKWCALGATMPSVGRATEVSGTPIPKATLEEILNDKRAEYKRRKQGNARKGSERYDAAKARALLQRLPELAHDITYEALTAYVDARLNEWVTVGRKRTPLAPKYDADGKLIRAGRHVSQHNVWKELQFLKSALVLAKKCGKYIRDPDDVIPDLEKDYDPKERWFEPLEFVGLSLVVEPRRMAQYAFAGALGADLCAIPRARRDDVRRDRRGKIIGCFVHGSKRDTRDRFVPTPLAEQQALVQYALDNGDGTDGFLFTEWPSFDQTLAKACTKLGIPHASANDFRRTYSHWLMAVGVPINLVATAMGHADGKQLGADEAMMVQRVYGRVDTREETFSSMMCIHIRQFANARRDLEAGESGAAEADEFRRSDSNGDKRNQNPLSCH